MIYNINHIKLKSITFCIFVLLAFGLTVLAACDSSKWCSDINDYSIIEACKEHCRKEAGGLVIYSELKFEDCMQSLGYYPCNKKIK